MTPQETFHAAIEAGDLQRVQQLRNGGGVDVNARVGDDLPSPLWLAWDKSRRDVLKVMLREPGIDLYLADTDGHLLIHAAAFFGDTGFVRPPPGGPRGRRPARTYRARLDAADAGGCGQRGCLRAAAAARRRRRGPG